jgi:hypothetical protein
MLHFDNAAIHCTDTVRDRMAAAELERMEHLPYSPALTACDFFFEYVQINKWESGTRCQRTSFLR